jgi:hypothetical protein
MIPMFTRAQFFRLSAAAVARHGITDRDDQFKMASMVIASITSSVQPK